MCLWGWETTGSRSQGLKPGEISQHSQKYTASTYTWSWWLSFQPQYIQCLIFNSYNNPAREMDLMSWNKWGLKAQRGHVGFLESHQGPDPLRTSAQPPRSLRSTKNGFGSRDWVGKWPGVYGLGRTQGYQVKEAWSWESSSQLESQHQERRAHHSFLLCCMSMTGGSSPRRNTQVSLTKLVSWG